MKTASPKQSVPLERRIAELELELAELRKQSRDVSSSPGDLFAMHRLVLESMSQGVSVSTHDGFIIYTNPAEDRMFGYEPGELIGQHVTVQNAYPPEDNEQRMAEVIAELGRSGAWAGDWFNKKKDGAPFYTRARITILDLSGAKYWVRVQERITEPHKTAEQYRGSEAELLVLLDTAPAFISRIDRNFRYVMVNRSYENWSGLRAEEIRGRHVRDLFGDEYFQQIRPALERVLTGEPVSFESQVTHRDGAQHNLLVTYTPERNEAGEVAGLIALIQDITDRTRAEQQLERAQNQLRQVIDCSTFGIALWNANGELMQANEALLRILGRTWEQMPKEPFAWNKLTPPEYRQNERDAIAELSRDGRVAQFEKEFIRPDGSRVPVLMGAASLPASGGTVCYVVDISEQKRAEQELRTSEERLRLAQEAARIGSWSLNILHPDENYWSDETYALAGMDRSWQPVYASWLAHVHPDDRAQVDQTVTHALSAGGGEFVITYRFRGTDLVERWHEARGRVRLDAAGNAIGANGITLDITERKRAEGEREAVERQLLLLIEASSSLLASPHSSDVLRTIVELAQRFISASAYAVWRKHSADLWQLSSSSGLSEEYVRTGMVLSPGPLSLPTAPLIFEDITKESFLQNRRQSLIHEGVRSMLVMPLHINGKATGTVVFYWKAKREFSGSEVRIASALGNLAASALGTAELYDRESQLRGQAESSESRAAFLAEAGAVLASSLDYQATLASVARLAVPTFADWAAVDILDERGEVQRVAVTHTNPDKVRFAYEFNKRYPPNEQDAPRVALRTGKSFLVEEIPDEMIDLRARDPEHARMIRQLGLKSFVIVPMVLGERSLGIITFATAESGRRYNAADLQTAEELARRGATAIDHARLYRDVRHSEERYRSLIVATAAIVWTADPRGRFVEPQQSWELHTGQSWRQYKGFRWLNAIHPDDREAVKETWLRCRDEERTFESEGRLWHARTKSYRHFVARAAAVRNADGSIREWVGAITDAHERKGAEEERASLLVREKKARQTAELLNQVGPVLLAELNLERLIQSVTDIATMLTGAQFGALFHNQKNEGGEPFLLYTLSGASRADFDKFPMLRHTQVFAPTFHDKQVVRSANIMADPRYGHNPPFHGMPEGHLPVKSYLAVPVVSRFGEVFGALIFGHAAENVFTEQHEHIVTGIAAQAAIALDNARLFAESQRAQLALERTNEELRRANEDLNQFAYSASHDLREPLRMVAIYSQMLQRRYQGKLDEEANEYFGYAIEGAKRMEMLVADLLAYTQAVNIAGEEHVTPISADAVLDKTLANLKGVFAESGATLERGTLPRLLVTEFHLLQLFQNLVGNAIKYRGENPPVITVDAQREGEMWRICIHDNGIGIAPEYAEQVFGIFKRLHNSDRYSGTGIGLAICQKICERYGGRIWVRSEGDGKGSAFCFTLPGAPETA